MSKAKLGHGGGKAKSGGVSQNANYDKINRLFFKHFEKGLVELKAGLVAGEEPLV